MYERVMKMTFIFTIDIIGMKGVYMSKTDGSFESTYGKVFISPKVIAKQAGIAACESFGVVGMASINLANGLAKLLTGDELTKGVHIEVVDNEIIIDLHIIVAFGTNIKACTDNIIESVKYKVEDLTKLKVKEINIFVEGIRVID